MQNASHDLRVTLDKVHHRQESINAVATMRENIDGFNKNAQNLHSALIQFDGTVEHTFKQIDSEVAEIVGKLAKVSQSLSNQNSLILEHLKDK
jgi:archaellum component FlaC